MFAGLKVSMSVELVGIFDERGREERGNYVLVVRWVGSYRNCWMLVWGWEEGF